MTLDEFADGKLADVIEEEVNDTKRRFAFGVFSRLISRPPEGTPRDTNRANNGWDLTVGSPGGSDPGETTPRRHTPQRAQSSRGEVERAKLEQPIYISNNVPYIVALNEGHSQQSPAKFVEIAVEREIKKAGKP